MTNYTYAETTSKNVKPEGEGWEYWGDKITETEHVAVWRRDADIYGEAKVPQ